MRGCCHRVGHLPPLRLRRRPLPCWCYWCCPCCWCSFCRRPHAGRSGAAGTACGGCPRSPPRPGVLGWSGGGARRCAGPRRSPPRPPPAAAVGQGRRLGLLRSADPPAARAPQCSRRETRTAPFCAQESERLHSGILVELFFFSFKKTRKIRSECVKTKKYFRTTRGAGGPTWRHLRGT